MTMVFGGAARIAISLIAAALIGACTSGPTIHQDTNPAAKFGSYKTFAFLSPLATDRFAYESLFTQHLKDATRHSMESRGYVFNERSPDLLVNFYVNVQNVQEIRTSPASPGYAGYSGGYYGYRSGYYGGLNTVKIETVNYKQGTLTLDLIDAKLKVLAWTSTAEGRVSSEAVRNPGPTIDALVANMMAAVPAAAQ